MPNDDSDLGVATATELAITFMQHFGDRALTLVEQQAERASGRTGQQWHGVATAIAILIEARSLLQRALSLLDQAGADEVSPYLDYVIAQLSLGGQEIDQTAFARLRAEVERRAAER
jgi:hypothetical protein